MCVCVCVSVERSLFGVCSYIFQSIVLHAAEILFPLWPTLQGHICLCWRQKSSDFFGSKSMMSPNKHDPL